MSFMKSVAYSTPLSSFPLGLLGSSAPVNIPGSSFQDRSGGIITNPSPSSASSPAFPHSFLQSSLHRENSLDQVILVLADMLLNLVLTNID